MNHAVLFLENIKSVFQKFLFSKYLKKAFLFFFVVKMETISCCVVLFLAYVFQFQWIYTILYIINSLKNND